MSNQLIEYNRKQKKIHKCIFQIYEKMEYNIKEKITPFSHVLFLEQLEPHDRDEMKKIFKKIYIDYEEYLYAILFENFGLNTPDSGDNRTLRDFKENYEIEKVFNCTSTDTSLFKILFKYEDKINNNQNINQNNLLSNP